MREADIRPIALLNEYLRLSAEDAKAFFANDASFSARNCPGCAANDAKQAFEKDGFNFVRCRNCQTLYANPAPAAEVLAEFYRASPSQEYWARTFFPAVAVARREKIFRPRVARIREIITKTKGSAGRLVDVGAGTGIFLEECRAAELGGQLAAIEPNDGLAALCRESGFETFEGFAGDATRADDSAWRESADLVTCFEVIEHVLDTTSFIEELAGLLRPGGTLLFTGLCGTGFDILTLNEHSKAVAPPHHLNFLSRDGVERLLARAGLTLSTLLTPGELDVDIVRNTYREIPGIPLDPFIEFLIQSDDNQAQANFQIFLKENALSSHMWVVARKPN